MVGASEVRAPGISRGAGADRHWLALARAAKVMIPCDA